MTKAATVVLGVGATKSGTSWLYRYLADHPGCHLRTIKELHYFDGVEKGNLSDQAADRRREVAAIQARIDAGRAGAGAQARLRDRADWARVLDSGREDEAAYLGYLDDGRGTRSVVGEVTPAYALLPEERLRAMAGLGGRDVRFVYLMRDPVARLWSHVRMIAGRRAPDGAVSRRRCDRILARTLAGEETQIEARGDYRAALEKLARAIDPSRLLVLVFEDLVGGDATARLCAFLGLAPRAPDLAPVHAGQPMPMTPAQAHAARDWLAPQYDFVADRLGHRPAGWRFDLAEVGS
ncbi:sulfotransferase [Palleronia sp. KMU-117]|uniref:sulfotransferase n=1 Tax=Palleronia sp. KMU-117 TaxID=3434108 RepID=UPI003D70673C